ncbi:MAG TPA: ankyrin repeat domain-containing protein [Rhizomicrobium sp.]|nr:ankyrin repeat domain-containing protein [Rhizomicrobium sp.]
MTFDQIRDGRTDLVFGYLAQGHDADAADAAGTSLIQWCAYYGDVSAVQFLVSRGAKLGALGENLGLGAAAFHGHWRLCQYLVESGADADLAQADTGETPLHNALCRHGGESQTHIVRILLAAGANPFRQTKPGAETGCFMRDTRTRAETPLHRAAAFCSEEIIRLLLDAGAKRDAKDMNGDTALSWASWHLRPTPILRMLCYGPFQIHPDHVPMAANLAGKPHL